MKPISFDGLDQRDAQTLLSQLRLHASGERAFLATKSGETIQEPTLATDDILANINALTEHINELETRLGGDLSRSFYSPIIAALETVAVVEPVTVKKLTLDEQAKKLFGKNPDYDAANHRASKFIPTDRPATEKTSTQNNNYGRKKNVSF